VSILKDEIARDIKNVWLSEDDYGETHYIDGRPVKCVIDIDNTLPLGGGYRLGISDAQIELYVDASDFPVSKKPGEFMFVDKKHYLIDAWDNEMGLLRIRLSKAETR
jgi:hypothetical protein